MAIAKKRKKKAVPPVVRRKIKITRVPLVKTTTRGTLVAPQKQAGFSYFRIVKYIGIGSLFVFALAIAITSGVFRNVAAPSGQLAYTPTKTPSAQAIYQYTATGGQLVTGAEVAASLTNIRSWRGAVGNNSRYWSTTRVAAGLDKQLFFDGVVQQGANKIIITGEDKNVTTGNAFNHQICDWVSSTSVDVAADANCTGGGWRTLNMRKVDYTSTADSSRIYGIYNGYFWDRTTTPGTKVDTPIANFIKTDSTKRVLIRVYSTVNSSVQHDIDEMRIELAIDPVYESSGFTKINSFAGATSAFVSDTIGTLASDANKFTITNDATNPMDVYFSFTGVRTYTGANTIVVKPEICVSTTALTFDVWIYNFTTPGWEQMNTSTITGTACATDTAYAFAKNNVTLTDYVSSNEVRIRFSTAVANTNTFQLDRLYMMVGSTNTDTALCEISMGTGTATDCANTRTVADAETGTTANTSTWQTTSVLEYPDNRWALDDDNSVDGEAGFASDLSFPVTVSSGMAVTAVHWAGRYRSNSASITVAMRVQEHGESVLGGWTSIGSSNTGTTYTWTDSWQAVELQDNAKNYVETANNIVRLKLRTSSSATSSAGTVRDWDFAMMSIRWVEEANRVTTQSQFVPTGGQLVIGAEVAASLANVRSWRGTSSDDSRYWSTTRDGSYGIDKQLFFDGVQQQNANKMIITINDKNVTTATAYIHQICDWTSSTYVDPAADANCTGGGWRTLNERNANHTNTSDTTRTYEIYDGYFWWEIGGSPGAKASTPISNFIKNDSSKRVLIRVFSLVGAATQHDLDQAIIELAIDPVYEASGFTKINSFSGATSNYVSYTIGTLASDANKFTITNDATNPMDVYFSFTGVRTYTGANTIVVKPEICVSTTALTFDVWIYNFTTPGWEQMNTSTITGTACATDTAYAFAKNNVTLTDYVSSNEVRIRFSTAVANTNTFQLDRLYMMVGSTNTDTALCEISMGTGTATDCANTRTVADAETGTTANTSTWQTTSVLEYPDNRWALDDDNSVDAEAGFSSNLSFPVTVSSGMAVTAVHWAARRRSNVATISIALNAKKYGNDWSGNIGTTNASTSYAWTDSWQSAEVQDNPEYYIDTVGSAMNLRLRTTSSTATSAGTVRDWDFAMMSIRWLEITVAPTTMSIAGIVYSDEGSNVLGTTPTVRIKVNGAGTYSVVAESNGTYSIASITTPSSGDVITVYLDGAAADAVLVTRYASGNLTGINLYQNRVIIRHEDAGPTTNTNLNLYDSTCSAGAGDTDIQFCVDSGNLTVSDGAKLLIWTGDTFTPGGTVTTSVSNDGTDSVVDGDVEVQASGTLSMATNALSVGGDFTNGGTFSESGSPQVTTFTATATGHSIDNGTGNLDNVTFNGSGGGWSFADASNTIAGDVTMTAGTLSGTNGMTVNGGDITGDATINFTGGTVLVDTAGNFGGATAWTFSNLTFGNGSGATETTTTGSGAITVSGVLTIAASQTLDAKGKTWTLSGTTGAPFVITGTFNDSTNTSTFAFTGNNGSGSTTIPASLAYNNLTVNNASEAFVMGGNTTASGNVTLTAATGWTLASGDTLTVQGTFVNSIPGATTWTGSTLYLNSGTSYEIGTKAQDAETYGTVQIGPATNIRWWNSNTAGTVTID